VKEHPWHELPPAVAEVLRPALDDVAREMIEAVAAVPAYRRPLEGPFGDGIRAGVGEALRHLLAEIEAGGPVARSDVYRALGRGEMRAGRSLDALLSAYRVGARVAWRRFARIGAEAGLDPETLYLLAESIFAYIDVLSAESAEGHAAEQSAIAGEEQLRRRRLVAMLVREYPAAHEEVRAAAEQARWALPRTLSVLAIAGDHRGRATSLLPADVIHDTLGEVTCAIVPDPDGPGRRAAIEHAVAAAGARGGLGTTVDWTRAWVSLRRARAALELAHADGELVAARERAGELLLRSDPQLAAELAADALAPLAALTPAARSRLADTLRAWLDEQGRLGAVARSLGVHPQTARYRIGRLRELFGGALDDPEARLWLAVALRVSRW